MIPRQICLDYLRFFRRIAFVIQRTGNSEHSRKVGHWVEVPTALFAQSVGMLFIALHNPLDPSAIFIVNRDAFLQKPVGMNAVAAVHDNARRAFQTMQKGEQFIQRFREVLFLVRRAFYVILSMNKAHAANVNAIRMYEPIWRETYADVVKYMQENPLQAPANNEANA